MALKIKTVMTYPLDGQTVDFSIPFEYLARKFVTVTLIGDDRKELVLNQDYRFTTKQQITTSRAWAVADGYTLIEIRRYTSATERLVDFADGSILRAYDLNISQVQTLHVAEEARDLTADTIGVNNDGNLDARGRRIVNVANPVDDFDALNLGTVKEWNNSAYQSYIKAQEEANRSRDEADRSKREADRATQQASASAGSAAAAKTSETNAKTSETNSKASENAAWDSRQKAATSETNAKSSENAAADSKVKAEAARDRAILEADKLENNNLFAGTIESIVESTSEVRMKGPFNAKSFWSSGEFVTEKSFSAQKSAPLRLLNGDNTAEVNMSYKGAELIYNYSGAIKTINFNSLALNSSGSIESYGDIVSRSAGDPSAPAGAYLNTPALRAGWRTRGNMPGVVNYARVSLYGQEHVGDSFSAIIDVVGYGSQKAWYFRQDGDFTSPGRVMAGGNLVAAGEVWSANGAARLGGDGNVAGPAYRNGSVIGHCQAYLTNIYLGAGRSRHVGQTSWAGWIDEGCVMRGINQIRSGSDCFIEELYFNEMWKSTETGSWMIG